MQVSTLAQVHSLELQVLWLAFALAILLGWVLQRSHFCSMGALSDWLLMRDTTRLRQWALALALAVLGLGAMTAWGWVDPRDSIYAQARFSWLSYALGGLAFGVGMVLASGCPAKNLVRLGGGSLKALVVLLVMGTAALATLRGMPGLLRVKWLDPVTVTPPAGPFIGQWVSAVLHLPPGNDVFNGFLLAAVATGLPLLLWALRTPQSRHTANVMGGLGVGAILLALWWVSGGLGVVPEHPETLERVFLTTASGRMEGLSFTGPVAQWLDLFQYQADGRKRMTFGMALVPGVALGAGLAAWRSGQWRWEGFTRTTDLARHLIGAMLMGMGGVSAMGCTFGQGLTGLSTLNWGSLVAVAAIVTGALVTLHVQWWLAERHG